MRTIFYVAAALATLNFASAISVPADSHSELQSFSNKLSKFDTNLAVFRDSKLDTRLKAGKSLRQTLNMPKANKHDAKNAKIPSEEEKV